MENDEGIWEAIKKINQQKPVHYALGVEHTCWLHLSCSKMDGSSPTLLIMDTPRIACNVTRCDVLLCRQSRKPGEDL